MESLLKLQSLIPSSPTKKPSKNHIHLTLKFLGDTEINLISEIKSALEQIKFTSFNLLFNSTGAFPTKKRPRILWIGISQGQDKLKLLSNQINEVLNELGIEKDHREFKAHLTLARVKRPISQPLRILNGFYQFSYGEELIPNFTSPVTKFILKKSTLTPNGPIYEDLHEIVNK
jgi:2'-5' RNA ligase